MKFFSGLAVAATLAGSAVTALTPDTAPVYILQKPSSDQASPASDQPPAIPRQIARQIFLRRIGIDTISSVANDIPSSYDVSAALDLINTFGGAATPLFQGPPAGERASEQPKKLFFVLEGVNNEQSERLAAAFSERPMALAFTVLDPPSPSANQKFFLEEIAEAAEAEVISANDGSRVAISKSGLLSMAVYDLSKSTTEFDVFMESIEVLIMSALIGQFEVTIVQLPLSSTTSPLQFWTTPLKKPSKNMKLTELRVRAPGLEAVMLDDEAGSPFTSSSKPKAGGFGASTVGGAKDKSAQAGAALAPSFVPNAASLPACFQSFNSCMTQTGKCSSHGECRDKYARRAGNSDSPSSGSGSKDDGSKKVPVCFVCHCFPTLNRPEEEDRGISSTKWGGNMCQKRDISAPFWLLTGFSVTLIGIVSFSIALLFNVGEEKLPGVIGAGVSRTK